MDIRVLDKDFNSVFLIDAYESLIWSDRYNEYGEVELNLPYREDFYKACKLGYYLRIRESQNLMIINQSEVISDSVEGKKHKVKGWGLTSLLTRRVINGTVKLEGNFQNAIKRLVNENFISPKDEARKVPNLTFLESTDSEFQKLVLEGEIEYTGDNVYTVIKDLCKEYKVGMRILPDFQSKGITFSLYKGANRSINQTALPHVVFSPKFDNLLSSENITTLQNTGNTAFVMGAEKAYKSTNSDKVYKTVIAERVENPGAKDSTTTTTTTTYRKDGSKIGATIVIKRDWKAGVENDEHHRIVTTTIEQAADGTEISRVVDNDYTGTKTRPYGNGGKHETVTKDAIKTTTNIDGSSKTEKSSSKKDTWKDKDGNVTWSDEEKFSDITSVDAKGNNVLTTVVKDPNQRPLDRYEIFVDARNIKTEDEDGKVRSEAEYKRLMTSQANRELEKVKPQSTYTGKIESRVSYQYKKDYWLGDVVSIVNEFGMKGTSRISEIVYTVSSSEISIVPTFTGE